MTTPTLTARGVPPAPKRAWTEAEDAISAEMRDAGRGWDAVAQRLGRTEDACISRRHWLSRYHPVPAIPKGEHLPWPNPRGMTKEQIAWARRTILTVLHSRRPVSESDRDEAKLILVMAREPVIRQGEVGWCIRGSATLLRRAMA